MIKNLPPDDLVGRDSNLSNVSAASFHVLNDSHSLSIKPSKEQ